MKNFAISLFILFCFGAKAQNECLDLGVNSAGYEITFQSTWNATDHSSIPTNAHWSNLVAISHNTPNAFMELGQNATLGVKNIAELGSNTAFSNEAQTAINAGNAANLLIEPFSPNNATSSITLTYGFCESHPYLTLLSMIAPSPDWFIAVNSLNMRSGNPAINDGWKEDFTVDVFAYDAGTDDGVDYDSPNSPNTPVGISMITGFPINGLKIGTLTVDYLATLSTEDFNLNESISVFPNPAKDKITISKNEAIKLKTIEIYNILGSLVKTVAVEDSAFSSLEVNINTLQKGVYLLKLETENGNSKTQKLIIK